MTSIPNSIYEARRAAAPGTCLSALSDDQVRDIADRIQTDMAASNLQITDARPVDQQVAHLTTKLEQLRAEYSKQITALSCARVLLRQIRDTSDIKVAQNDVVLQALLAEIGEPDVDDCALAHLVRMRAMRAKK